MWYTTQKLSGINIHHVNVKDFYDVAIIEEVTFCSDGARKLFKLPCFNTTPFISCFIKYTCIMLTKIINIIYFRSSVTIHFYAKWPSYDF